ncbi:hypothetical protein HOLleu_03621 [Holothuria leucospilota]|uniref:Integrase catalytic domain-containing protein n=1 Tax=Holothuria leucospilota TaxID=206669 RepID=A0A9Q1CS67_HOLLE|nr:hypothetical protein HOLleu_03621 [Holothuria leucospilota]
MCVSLTFPEATPIRVLTILQILLNFFTLFWSSKEIQSDQGSNFMSPVFHQRLYEMGIEQMKSYHFKRLIILKAASCYSEGDTSP